MHLFFIFINVIFLKFLLLLILRYNEYRNNIQL